MEANPRRQVQLAVAGTAALLVLLALVLWRTLPPVYARLSLADSKGAPAFEPLKALPTVLPVPDAQGVTYAVIDEPNNEQLTEPGFYASDLTLWRTWLEGMNARAVAPDIADVLILPEARCLGPENRVRIAAHLKRGGGIVTTGALGAFQFDCKASPDTVLNSLLGGGGNGVLAQYKKTGNEAFYAIMPGGGALAAGIPPGARIIFTPLAQVAFRSDGDRELYYADFDRQPRPIKRADGDYDVAVTRSHVAAGRVVAFGFSMQTLEDDFSRRIMQLMVANALRWSAGRPIYQIAAWPYGKTAAAVMSQDVEADYQNARNSIRILKALKIPATAFIVGNLAEADPLTTSQLVASREIATHSYSHLPLDTFSYAAQARELAHSKAATEKLSGRPVLGLRPPEERFNLETIEIWADLGGTFMFGSNNLRLAAPEIIPVLPDSLIMLARVTGDDFEILSRDGVRDRGQIVKGLVADVEHVIEVGGLYMLSYHSHLFAQESLAPVLKVFAEYLVSREDLWLTTAGSVAQWWRDRSRLRIEEVDGGVRIVNTGTRPFENGVLIVDMPDDKRLRLDLPAIQPGGSIVIDPQAKPAAAPTTTAAR